MDKLVTSFYRQLELLVSMREQAGVPLSNKYLFGNCSRHGHFNAANVILEFSNKCGAADPKSLRTTRLRKQIATLSQMLTLSENEIRQLAKFMGHSFEVHCKYYRTPEANTHITKLSKLFMLMEDVDPTKFRGKTIEELDVENLLPQGANESSDEGVCRIFYIALHFIFLSLLSDLLVKHLTNFFNPFRHRRS